MPNEDIFIQLKAGMCPTVLMMQSQQIMGHLRFLLSEENPQKAGHYPICGRSNNPFVIMVMFSKIVM